MDQFQLEERFHQFIEFGQLFDEPTRRYLVAYLNHRLFGTELPEFDSPGRYFEYLRDSLDRVFDHEPLLQIARDNEGISHEIMEDVLKWIKKADKKIREGNPYYTEMKKLEAWAHKPTFLWRQNWYDATNLLKNTYRREEMNPDFYADKFNKLMPQGPKTIPEQEVWDKQPQKHEIDVLIDDLLAQWDALLTEKLLKYQIEELEEEQAGFSELLHAKIEEYKKLMDIITPFATEAGRYWDMSRGLWQAASFNILEKYKELLENEESIKELADLLGRMRQAEIELEEETYENVIVRKEWVDDFSLREEISGLHGSNDLNRMLPSEAVFLADDGTSDAFYQKFADQNLMSFRYQGQRLVTSDKVNQYTRQRQKKKEKGPFILCIDTSGSMHGLPSQIAKVLAFAVMKMAAKEQRKCYLINFSIGIKTLNLHDIANSMDKIVEFLTMSFDGGTDVSPALSEALHMLQTNDYKDADVLMVSDFVMFELREELLERIKREQHKGTKFHSLIISDRPNQRVLSAFDNCWTYDLEDRRVIRQMLEDLGEMERD